MLRITIELVPYGIESKKRILAQAIISNDGTGTINRGNYQYSLYKTQLNRTYKEGKIKDFPRKSLGVWNLLHRVLKNVYEK